MTVHYGTDRASVDWLAHFMRDAMTALDAGIYANRANMKIEPGLVFDMDDLERHLTGQLLNFREGRLASDLRQALQEGNPERVAQAYGSMEMVVGAMTGYDTEAICKEYDRSVMEFKAWFKEGEDAARRGSKRNWTRSRAWTTLDTTPWTI